MNTITFNSSISTSDNLSLTLSDKSKNLQRFVLFCPKKAVIENIMKLTPNERIILAAIQLNADSSLAEIRKASGCREHQIRYCIEKYKSKDIILKRPVINWSLLGYTEYSIILSLTYKNARARSSFRDFLISSKLTGDVSEVGGNYDFLIATLVRNVRELHDFFLDIANLTGVRVIEKRVAARIVNTSFRRKHLAITAGQENEITIEHRKEPIKVDAIDEKIIYGLVSEAYDSIRELARKLELPHSTVDQRLKYLKSCDVLVGFVYGMHFEKMGLRMFRLLITAPNPTALFSKSLCKWAAKHKQVIGIIQTVGAWDYEINVEVNLPGDIKSITQELFEEFSSSLDRINCLSAFAYPKVTSSRPIVR